MQRQRGDLVPIGEALADLPGPVQGAKRRSEPLTARTDLESSGTRGKGITCTNERFCNPLATDVLART